MVVVEGYFSVRRMRPDWHVVGVWPRAEAQVPDYIPEYIGELWREAAVSLNSDCYRAAALMTRGALEAALKEKKAKGSTLYDKIESMKGTLRPQLIEIAGALKDGGNAAGHEFSHVVTREEAAALFEFLGEVLKELYEAPRRLANLKELGANRPTL